MKIKRMIGTRNPLIFLPIPLFIIDRCSGAAIASLAFPVVVSRKVSSAHQTQAFCLEKL
jgi:hypothetical protein